MFRALPYHKKDVGATSRMIVADMDLDLWNYWISTHENPPSFRKKRKVKYADHGFKRQEEVERIGWKGGQYPTLASSLWYLKKWADLSTGVLHRALIKEISFIRNRWTEMVRVEFSYETWFYDDTQEDWKLV